MVNLEHEAQLFYEEQTARLPDAPPWSEIAKGEHPKSSWLQAVAHGRRAGDSRRQSITEETDDDMLSTTQIGQRLGITVSAQFIEKVLDVPRSDKKKAASLWTEDQFGEICDALTAHIERMKAGGKTPELVSTRKPRSDKGTSVSAPATTKIVSQGPVDVEEDDLFSDDEDDLFADDEEDPLFAE